MTGDRVVLDVPARPGSVALVRNAVRGALEARGTTPGRVAEVLLAVSEACTNAVVHAHGSPPRLEAEIGWSDERIEVRVRDFGAGFAPSPDRPGLGLGLPVIAAVAEAVEIRTLENGTEVVMRFDIGRH